MGWTRITEAAPPTGRPLLVRTAEGGEPEVAFLGADGLWYAGGALVQSATTVLASMPTQWCEPDGEDSL